LPDATISAPEFKQGASQFRPGTRWWWQAPLSTSESIREINAIAAAGFGEVEIAFSSGAWNTTEQRANLRAVLEEADRLGVTVSMTMGAAWPVQTPNTGRGTGYASQELQYGRVDLVGGELIRGPVPAPFDADIHDQERMLVAVTAARVVTRGPAAELLPPAERPKWGTPVRVPSESTILDAQSLVDLTDRVTANDEITWAAPDGDWILFAFWARENVTGNTNPFDANAARAATEFLDSGQVGSENAEALTRAGGDFFEDSLELNAYSIFWTPDMQEQFASRRGYDMAKYLPLVFAHGMSNYWVPNEEPTPDFDLPYGEGAKIREDYYRLLTDLYVDQHLTVYQDWAGKHGLQFKAQVAYGQDLEPIRSGRSLARLGGRVETESFNSGDRFPTNIDNPTWRFALDHQRQLASGVHQAGVSRLSTELGAQYHKTYELGIGDYREMMDKEWATGVTRPFLHGYAYLSESAPWPGRQRFGEIASESWNDVNYPQWPMWKHLTAYWARGTRVLEGGTARADVAIYRSGFLTSAARGSNASEDTVPERLFDVLAMEMSGHTVEFVDPEGLAENGVVGNAMLFGETAGYRALVVDQRAVSAESAVTMAAAARAGVRVVFVGALPDRDTTYASGAAGDVAVREAIADALRQPTVVRVQTPADVAGALAKLGVRPRADSNGKHVLFQWREVEGLRYIYLYNPTNDRIDFNPSFEGEGVPSLLELWTGDIRQLAQYATGHGRTVVSMTLDPREATVIALDLNAPEAVHVVSAVRDDLVVEGDRILLRTEVEGERTLTLSDGRSTTVAARLPEVRRAPVDPSGWSLDVQTRQPGDGRTITIAELSGLEDWREMKDLRGEAGVATYTGTADIPAEWLAEGHGVNLRLGHVAGTAEIIVNGRSVGAQVVDGPVWDVSEHLQPGRNILEVVVRTVLRNAVTNHRGTSTRTIEVGLRGPVRFQPYAEVVVHDPATERDR